MRLLRESVSVGGASKMRQNCGCIVAKPAGSSKLAVDVSGYTQNHSDTAGVHACGVWGSSNPLLSYMIPD
jgi:hypothetical protein